MAHTAKRKSSRKIDWNRLPETGIPGYEAAGLPDQVALFSKLIEKKPMTRIHAVWKELDDWARTIVMWHLGCFAGENSPQVIYARREQIARESLADVSDRMRCVSKLISRQTEQVQTTVGLNIRDGKLHFITRQRPSPPSPFLVEELAILQQKTADLEGRLPPRSKWNARRMIIAQRFVSRRAKFLGLPDSVRLTPEAIAEVYALIRVLPERSREPDTPENIRKAIANFSKSDVNRASIERMESMITNWANHAALA